MSSAAVVIGCLRVKHHYKGESKLPLSLIDCHLQSVIDNRDYMVIIRDISVTQVVTTHLSCLDEMDLDDGSQHMVSVRN